MQSATALLGGLFVDKEGNLAGRLLEQETTVFFARYGDAGLAQVITQLESMKKQALHAAEVARRVRNDD